MAKKHKPAKAHEIINVGKEHNLTKQITPGDLAAMAHDDRTAAALRAARTALDRRRAKEAYFERKAALRDKAAGLANSGLRTEVHVSQGQIPFAGEGSVTNTKLTPSQMQRLRALVTERIERRREALKVWVAMPTQQEFQNCTAKERVVYGSNRCLGAEQRIYDPVAGHEVAVGSLRGDFHVYACDASGRTVVSKAHKPFLKGVDRLYRVTLANGRVLTTTLGHRLLSEDGWISVGHAIQRHRQGSAPVLLVSSEEPFPSASSLDARHLCDTPEDCSVDYPTCDHSCDAQLLRESGSDPGISRPLADAREHIPTRCSTDGPGCKSGRNHPCRPSGRPSSQCASRHPSDHDGASESPGDASPCLQQAAEDRAARQSAQSSTLLADTFAQARLCSSECFVFDEVERQPALDEQRHSTACILEGPQFERYRILRSCRDQSSPACRTWIVSAEYVRTDEFYDFEVPVHHNYWCQTTLSHNSGKTTVSAVEVALIVCGLHPKLSGTKLPKEGGIACIVGYDYGHVGRVLYRKLFKPGAFRVIRDATTGEYRPYEPDGVDKGTPRHMSEPAPALIPKRMIAPGGVNWYRRKENIPKSIKLTTGWELRFYSSEGEPPQGDAVHLFWLDEEMINEAWYTESARGLMDEGGFFIWSATPHVGGDALIDLHERAEKQRMDPGAVTREFLLLIFDNIHAAAADKNELIDKFKDNPEVYRTRILGEFAAKAFKVYSEFSMAVHGFDMEKIHHSGKIPDDWCRFVAIDPGHQVTAVLFLAVPPPGTHTYKWYVYDELYLEKCSPTKFAEAFEVKTRGQAFEAFIIDMRAGRVTTMGGEKPVEQIYREALGKVKVRRSSERERHIQGRPPRESDKFEIVNCWERVKHQMFVAGADNPKAGISAVKEALQVQISTGMSQVVFARGRLPNLEYEMAHYHHKRVKGKLTDELSKKDDHLMDCLRYLVCARPEWQRPKRVVRPATAAQKRLRAKAARLESGRTNSVNLGPRSSRTLVAS